MSAQVVLVDDEQHLRTACTQALELAGFEVESFASAEGALDRVSRTWGGLLVSDIRMAGMDGLELMGRALELDPELPVILITGHGDIPMAVQAMRDGAYDFIEKPFASEVLVDAVTRGMEMRRLVLENRALRAQLEDRSDLENSLIGRSPAVVRLREEVLNLAATDADVLIVGETGSGKELVARSLHDHGPRRGKRFVPINCGALPDTVIESELFGHVAGAFTGANKTRLGKFEYAEGGTLFLDEIESMPLELQIKLLRVLQDRAIVRLGANEEIPVDVRVIAATKQDLKYASEQGTFREDLYYRLNVLSLAIPPLSQRGDDIALLFHHFVDQAAARCRREPPAVTAECAADLLAHDWPGNVRELQNAALRYALGLRLDCAGGNSSSDAAGGEERSLAEQVAAAEQRIIAQALSRHDGRLKPTYEALGISRKTLYDKIKKYGLDGAGGGEH